MGTTMIIWVIHKKWTINLRHQQGLAWKIMRAWSTSYSHWFPLMKSISVHSPTRLICFFVLSLSTYKYININHIIYIYWYINRPLTKQQLHPLSHHSHCQDSSTIVAGLIGKINWCHSGGRGKQCQRHHFQNKEGIPIVLFENFRMKTTTMCS